MSSFWFDFTADAFPQPAQSDQHLFEDPFLDVLSIASYWQGPYYLDASAVLDPSFLLDFDIAETELPHDTVSQTNSDIDSFKSDPLQISMLACDPQQNEAREIQKVVPAPSFYNHNKEVLYKSDSTSFQDHLHEFEAGPRMPSSRRKRKRFSTERRREVEQLRKIGACLRCRIAKCPCQIGQPCAPCIKAGGDMNLGKTLCTRQSLVGIRFSLDLWNRDNDITWLAKQVGYLEGPTKTVRILLFTPHKDVYASVELHHDLDRRRQYETAKLPRDKQATLELKVQSFSPVIGREDLPDTPSCISEYQEPTILYAIPDGLLPSLPQIEAWALETMMNLYPTHPSLGFLRVSFVRFAWRYWDSEKDLPLKNMVAQCVRLTALHGVWRRVLVEDSTERHCVSAVVHTQLATIIAKGIIDLEIDLLSTLQQKILGGKGLGKNHMLPVWACLWLLILTYRDTIDAWQSAKPESDGRTQLARQMYDTLVSLYSGLFRPSSPLRLNWLVDNNYELLLFDRDQFLMHAMGCLKTEFAQFDKFRAHHHSKDTLLRKLIFEREMKGMKPQQDSLSQSYYESSRVYYPLRVSASDRYEDPTIIATQANFIQSI